MTDASERSAARQQVERLAQTSVEPALDAGEVEAALDTARTAQVWAAETAYSHGDRVVPASSRGRYYRCVEPGTSGATEPTFPVYDGGQVTDGTCTWEEAGYFGGRLYDVRTAVYRALSMRYAKDELVDASADGRSIQGSQRSARILELMRRYRPVGIA